jgi:hypothetical protein
LEFLSHTPIPIPITNVGVERNKAMRELRGEKKIRRKKIRM